MEVEIWLPSDLCCELHMCSRAQAAGEETADNTTVVILKICWTEVFVSN